MSVLELSRTAALFPAEERDLLRADLVCYGRAVAAHEWVTMRDGERSEYADHWVAAYGELLGTLSLGAARERLAYEELLREADRRTDGRRERLTQARPSVPTPLWIVLLLGGVVTIASQIALADPRERRAIQAMMIAGVTAVVAAGLLLVNFLDHPYEDHTGSIQPTEMRQTLSMIEEEDGALPVRCDDGGVPL